MMPPRPVPPDKHTYGEIAWWVKGVEAQLVRERKLGVIIRPGDRSDKDTKQWLPMFAPVPIFFLTEESAKGGPGTPVVCEEDDLTTAMAVRRTTTRIKDVKNTDLEYNGLRAVPQTAAEVQTYLETELAPEKRFTPESVITIYWLEYVAWAEA